MHDLRAEAGRRPDGADRPHAARKIARFLAQLAPRALERTLVGLRRSGRDFPKGLARRMAVLANEDNRIGSRRRDDRHRSAVLDDVDAMLASVGKANVVDSDLEDAAFEALARGENARRFFHDRALAERRNGAS